MQWSKSSFTCGLCFVANFHIDCKEEMALNITLGTSVRGGLRHVMWYPNRHLLHSIIGTSSGSACPHIWHTSTSVNSSSSKSSVIRRYALSPTLNVSSSTVTEDMNWRKCFSLVFAFLVRLRNVLCAFFDAGAGSDAGMASANLLVAACAEGASSLVPFMYE